MNTDVQSKPRFRTSTVAPSPAAPARSVAPFVTALRALRALIALTVLLPLLAALAGCSGGDDAAKAKQQKRPVPVTTALSEKRDLPVVVRTVGNVEPYATVSVKSRVDGQIVGVHFREGQDVRKGDLLFSVDRRALEAALNEAQARLQRDRVLLAKADEDVRRFETLVADGYVSREQFEQYRSTADSLRATVRADEAAVETARVQLSYSTITAPMSGRAGQVKVDQGNMVRAGADTVLVVIDQIEPIYVGFALPEMHLAAARARMAAGGVPVEARVPGPGTGEGGKADGGPGTGTAVSARGAVTFVDNAVNTATGTIRMRGTFANESRVLWPGQFVDVYVELGILPGVVVVPSQAVQTGSQGLFAYVVGRDDTVQLRKVRTGLAYGGLVVVEEGVAEGERVVVDGHLRLTPGAVVEEKAPAGEVPAAQSSPSGQPGQPGQKVESGGKGAAPAEARQ
ncbi:efflux RND transporter periplasmic adaptor subunit [Nitratidesulfovibrio sp. 1201_IL3209]|uniref:efflux RND transporter periplasmic adaptor subunit n=1 Tax=Nitratidesulfovibrio sp. 1201_IL3209 TaxID=3084053 RepID=UPI002FDB4D06